MPGHLSMEEVFARACELIPGGVSSPVRAFGSVGGTPAFLASAKGPHVVDITGREYVDLVCSWGPALLGHAHPEVVAAVSDAATRGLSFGAPTTAEVELAAAVKARIPFIAVSYTHLDVYKRQAVGGRRRSRTGRLVLAGLGALTALALVAGASGMITARMTSAAPQQTRPAASAPAQSGQATQPTSAPKTTAPAAGTGTAQKSTQSTPTDAQSKGCLLYTSRCV